MIAHDTDAIRADRSTLLAALQDAGADVSKPNAIRCPFHEDTNPSAGVYQSDGVWRFKCHGCGVNFDVFDVQAKASGREVADVLREHRQQDPPTPARTTQSSKPKKVYPSIDAIKGAVPGNVEDAYAYTNPDTRTPDLVVVRFMPAKGGKKQFWQARPVAGGFELAAPPKPWPLYNRSRVATADRVVVVEGEKAVHALHDLGIVGTTSPGGAGKAEHADWSPLAGKTVALWPDNDATGIEHMQDVGGILEKLANPPAVSWIDPTALGLAEKGDVFDFIAAMGDCDPTAKRHTVITLIDNAEPMGASREVNAIIEDTIAGRRVAVCWPWSRLAALTKALLPGTVTILCGDAGATKSFLLLEAAAYWHAMGIKLALFELEEDRGYHLTRALAQADSNGSLTDDEWVRENPDDAREAYARHAAMLDSFGRCIWEAPDAPVTLKSLAGWVTDRAKAGYRIIAIDPVTAAETTAKPWIDDHEFIMAAKTAAREYGASVVLVTHPRKGRKGAIGLDELAGGSAYVRFSQTILWLEHHKQPKDVNIATALGPHPTEINRTLHLVKTRNGKGAGAALGFTFDTDTLRFREHGIIRKGATA